MSQNATFDEIKIGDTASLVRTLQREDVEAFAAVTGDTNPAHLDPEYARTTQFRTVIGHGMWAGSMISALLGTRFPGPGTIYLQQTFKFTKPVRIGDTLTAHVTVLQKDEKSKRLTLKTEVINQKGQLILGGEAVILAPEKKFISGQIDLPQVAVFDPEARLRELVARGAGLPVLRCAVVQPCDADSLSGALMATREGVIQAVLVGPKAKIMAVAQEQGLDLSGIDIVNVAHSHAAAEKAAQMAAAGDVAALMKGSLHTDELMHAVLAEPALRTGRRMSHVFHFDVPMYGKPLLITDAALNIRPNLLEKADIIQNAIDFAHVLGVEQPKVAILAAVEVINPTMPATLDAAALCKMADRRQIQGGLLDGPLAFDNAISPKAVAVKHIDSPVAGRADILLVPDLEAGNMLAKQLEYLAGASASGLVLGARVPIILTSRSDGSNERLASAALARLVAAAGLTWASRE